MMFNKSTPPNYITFEDPRVWEICAYRWGDTTELQEVNGSGGVLSSGTLSGDGLVYSDYIFAACYAINAKGSSPAIPARTVEYRIELEVVNSSQTSVGAPWEVPTQSDGTNNCLWIGEYSRSLTASANIAITAEQWEDSSYWESQTSLISDGNGKYHCNITTTTSCQYLRIGIRVASGVSVNWKIVSVGITRVPLGITQKQCAAVDSLGVNNSTGGYFYHNTLITAFTELRYFTKITDFNTHSNSFNGCKQLTKLRFPEGTTIVGFSLYRTGVMNWNFYPDTLTTMANCGNICIDTMIVPSGVTSIAQRAWSGDAAKRHTIRWIVFESANPPTFSGNPFYIDYSQVKLFVPDGSVDTYKAVSQLSSVSARIYPISDFETYFPDESYIRNTTI